MRGRMFGPPFMAMALVAVMVTQSRGSAAGALKLTAPPKQAVKAVQQYQAAHRQGPRPGTRMKFDFWQEQGLLAKLSAAEVDSRAHPRSEYRSYLLRKEAGRWRAIADFYTALAESRVRALGVSKATLVSIGITVGQSDSPFPSGLEIEEGSPGPAIEVPYNARHFRILWDASTDLGRYEIVPRIPFGGPRDQPPQYYFRKYWRQYVQYGREALRYLEGCGVRPTKANITWWGQEWWPKGAEIPLGGSPASKGRLARPH
jgi:hypothetical protein